MNVKKILIIQTDGPYFLEETLSVIKSFAASFKEFVLTILVSDSALNNVSSTRTILGSGITTNTDQVLKDHFDMSFNLSLNDKSWDLHAQMRSDQKIGPYLRDGQLIVADLWSTFYLTIKSQSPFLTFHLQDIFSNILGIKKVTYEATAPISVKEIVVGNFAAKFFSPMDKRNLTRLLEQQYPHLPIKEISAIDLVSDLTHTLYLGPADIQSLRLCEAGAMGLFCASGFQGLNLLPHRGSHYVISTGGAALEVNKIMALVSGRINHGIPVLSTEYHVYEIEHENLFGAYIKALNHSDQTYPFYQSHVVLWNFLLNLFDVNLDVTKCSPSQIQLMHEHQKVLTKLVRLHDYAMSSVDSIYQESKSLASSGTQIEGHLKNLREIDEIMEKLAHSHTLIRPFLDYYRVRRGQNDGATLAEQIQHTFITYYEEHHALAALTELFSVTLRKNEVNI
jgi:hypothetical protein